MLTLLPGGGGGWPSPSDWSRVYTSFYVIWTYCGEISGKLNCHGGCCSQFRTRGQEKLGI